MGKALKQASQGSVDAALLSPRSEPETGSAFEPSGSSVAVGLNTRCSDCVLFRHSSRAGTGGELYRGAWDSDETHTQSAIDARSGCDDEYLVRNQLHWHCHCLGLVVAPRYLFHCSLYHLHH
jgi:hypothetical protein